VAGGLRHGADAGAESGRLRAVHLGRRGHEVRPEHKLAHEPMTSHGMKARLPGMLRRSSSPASTANPNAHRM
jgi:hypothetical protein